MAKIIMIEDEPDIARITAFRLQKAGYEVLVAEDGIKGLDLVRKENPGLVLLDLNIPGMSGENVCLELKKDEKTAKIPVIILSASAPLLKEKSGSIGADGFLVKPFDSQNLIEIIRKYIK